MLNILLLSSIFTIGFAFLEPYIRASEAEFYRDLIGEITELEAKFYRDLIDDIKEEEIKADYNL